MKYDTIIAIDPDVHKSGVSYLEVSTRKLEVSNMTFPQLLDYLQFFRRECQIVKQQKVVVVVEAGWLNKVSNYHTQASKAGQRIAKNVGSNHETGRKIVEMAKHYGLEVVEHAPLCKCWRGKDGKITHDELAQFTGLKGSTNQDSRDSAILAWTFANLPIKLKVE